MSSLRTFPGSSVTQQDLKLCLCICKDALCGLMCTVLYVCGKTLLVRVAEAVWQHEIKFYDLMCQAWCSTILAFMQLLSPSCLVDMLLHTNKHMWLTVPSKIEVQRGVCEQFGFFLSVCDEELCVSVESCASVESNLFDWLYSAGCGRTGAICAIDYTWNLLKAGVCEHIYTLLHIPKTYHHKYINFCTLNVKVRVRRNNFAVCCVLLKKIPEDFNVFRLIQEMRTQRHSAVQTKVCV